MPSRTTIHVPDTEKQPLRALSDFSEDDYLRLLAVVNATPPQLQVSKFSITVNDRWQDVGDGRDVSEITDMLLRVARSKLLFPADEEEINKALLSLFDHGELLDRDSLLRRLKTLVNTDSISLTAEAGRFLTAQHNAYQTSRAFTEIRPIYLTGKPDDAPTASVIIHQLEFKVRSSDEEFKIYVALDDIDLLELKAVLERSIKRGEVLRETEKSSGRTVLRP